MRWCRSDLCLISQQSWFLAFWLSFCFINYPALPNFLTPLPSQPKVSYNLSNEMNPTDASVYTQVGVGDKVGRCFNFTAELIRVFFFQKFSPFPPPPPPVICTFTPIFFLEVSIWPFCFINSFHPPPLQREANKLVEELMLMANRSVARRIFSEYPEATCLRNHSPPKPLVVGWGTEGGWEKFFGNSISDFSVMVWTASVRYKVVLFLISKLFRRHIYVILLSQASARYYLVFSHLYS